MKDPTPIRERIMEAAAALMDESGGDTAALTTRAIAQRAGVGTGLINYHFQTKENLLTLCVQRKIARVVQTFRPDALPGAGDAARLSDWAARVFEFLFENPSVSRLSILGDLAAYTADCNSVRTQEGLTRALTEDTPPEARGLLAFALVAVMQSAFLSGAVGAERTGGDFATPEGRRAWIDRVVALLYRGIPVAAASVAASAVTEPPVNKAVTVEMKFLD